MQCRYSCQYIWFNFTAATWFSAVNPVTQPLRVDILKFAAEIKKRVRKSWQILCLLQTKIQQYPESSRMLRVPVFETIAT